MTVDNGSSSTNDLLVKKVSSVKISASRDSHPTLSSVTENSKSLVFNPYGNDPFDIESPGIKRARINSFKSIGRSTATNKAVVDLQS